jgi:hypothetical protein
MGTELCCYFQERVVIFDAPEVSVLSGHALALHQVQKKAKLQKMIRIIMQTLSGGACVCRERHT